MKTHRLWARALPFAIAAVLAASSAWAEAPAAQDLSRYKEEPVPGGALLVAAYMAMWAIAAGFVGWTLLRQQKAEAALRELEDRLDAGAGR